MSSSDASVSSRHIDRRMRDQLTLLVDSVTDYAILLLDPDGQVITWNTGAERLKGYTADEIIGGHFSRFYPPEDAGQAPADLEIAAREGRCEEEGWRVRKDGSRFWAAVVITCVRDAAGAILGYGKVTRDLTSRRLTEERMRASTQRLEAANAELQQFRRLVLGVRDYAIFLLDAGGHVATWNPGAEHIKGYSAEEIVGRSFSVFYTREDRDRDHPREELEIAARDGRYEEHGWRLRKDGTRFWASVVLTAIRDERGDLIGYAKVTRDLTERRETEEALRRSTVELERTNAELDRFTSVAAHDLQEPLRTVSGFAELLARRYRGTLDEQAEKYIGHITGATERMQRMITDLLAFAKAGERVPPPQPVALARSTEHVVADLRAAVQERGAEVVLDVPADALVAAAPSDVDTLLRNLLSNALKFSDAQAPRVAVAAQRRDGAWCVDVIDNGIGIDPADRPRIFDAFRRAHSVAEFPGTGLGLAICQRVVERNGGAIGVDSELGRGSRFWFELPAA